MNSDPRIIMVDPGFGPDSFDSYRDSHWSSVINHGLCSISAYVKSHGYADISLLDVRQLKDWEDFDRRMKEARPDVVAITMRSCDHKNVARALESARTANPSVRTVIGGPHPTALPADLPRDDLVDHVVVGEGEIAFRELLDDICAGRTPPRLIHGASPVLDDLPFEDRELYDYARTVRMANYPGIFKPPMVTMVTCRGCAFRCGFCAPHAEKMFGKRMRYRSPERVLEELSELHHRWGYRSIKFYNSDFLARPGWVHEFCDLYGRSGIGADIMIQTRASSLCRHEDALAALRDVGLKLVLMGWESGSQRILDFLQKGCSVEDNFRSAEICRRQGIMFGGSFMFGVPTETPTDIRASVELAQKARPYFTSVAFFTPLPGSYLYEYCEKNDLSLVKDPDDLLSFSPEKEKIKGVDYDSARAGAEEILGMKFGGRRMGRLVRGVYVLTKGNLKLRHFLVYSYSKLVSNPLYRRLNRRTKPR
ncbi:MAG: radical SAM protein [Gaiellales bacterium]|nr:MAG: radical SAM protein [Gaiellales bacterium]